MAFNIQNPLNLPNINLPTTAGKTKTRPKSQFDIRKFGSNVLGGLREAFTPQPTTKRTPTKPMTPFSGGLDTTTIGGFTIPSVPFGLTPKTPTTPAPTVGFTPMPQGSVTPQNQGFAPEQAIPQVTQQTPQVAPVSPVLPPTSSQDMTSISETTPETARTATGGVSAPPVTPPPPETQKAVSTAEQAVIDASNISPEELSTQEDIKKLLASSRKAFTNIQDQPIPMEFITGQLASIERVAQSKLQTLQDQLAIQQAKRLSSLESSKFALDRADKKADSMKAEKPFTVSAGASVFDPNTGEFIGTAPKPQDTSAPQTIETAQGIMQWNPATQNWESTGLTKPISEAAGIKAMERAEKISEKEETKQIAARRTLQQSNTAITNIETALSNPSINAGALNRVVQSKIPGTEDYNLARTIDTVKALVGFGALEEMRKASPTGGALGQVSEREISFLQATLGSMDIGQDSRVLKANLERIRDSFATLRGLSIAESGAEVEAMVTDPNTGETVTTMLNKQEINNLMLEGNTVKFL